MHTTLIYTHVHTHTAIPKWFIDPEVQVEVVLKKPNELTRKHVERCLENLPDALLDENDLHHVAISPMMPGW